MKPQEIIDALSRDMKDKAAVSALIDQLLENYSEEIANLGDAKRDRLERNAAMGNRISDEHDKRADLLIRRKDLLMDIKAKLNGQKPETIVIPADQLFIEDKRPAKRRLLFGRKAAARAT